jgi:hypothetical protein
MINNCYPPIIPSKEILDKLLPNEKILFSGSYYRPDLNKLPEQNSKTATMKISVNPVGLNIISTISSIGKLNNLPINFLNETYTFSSWNTIMITHESKKVGIIEITSLYDNAESDSTLTVNNVERFIVTGSFGIYKNITSVLIQYYSDLNRIIYFISDNC